MSRLSYAAIAGLGLSFLVLGGATCPGSKSTKPKEEASILLSQGKLLWFGVPGEVQFVDLGALEQSALGYNRGVSKCDFMTANKQDRWKGLKNDLIAVHNKLVERRSEYALGDAGGAWVATPSTTPAFVISYLGDTLRVQTEAGLKATPAVNVQARQRYSDAAVSLFLGSIRTKVSLQEEGANCIEQSLCAQIKSHPETKRLRYLTALFYGTSLGLRLTGAELEVGAAADVVVGQYGAKLKFDLNTEHIEVVAAVLGSLNLPDNREERAAFIKDKLYDVPQIIDDLSKKGMNRVQARWTESFKENAVIGAEYGEVTAQTCAAKGLQ